MFSRDISQIAQKELIKGFKARFVHSDSMTIAYWEIDKGSELPLHAHVHEQISMVTEGKLEMNIGGEIKIYEPGTIAVIPSNVEHSGKAITDCKVTDIFSPVREDYQ